MSGQPKDHSTQRFELVMDEIVEDTVHGRFFAVFFTRAHHAMRYKVFSRVIVAELEARDERRRTR